LSPCICAFRQGSGHRRQAPCSVYDNFLTSIYQVEDAGSQFFYPFDTHRARIRLFVDREEGIGSGSRPELKRQPFTFDCNIPTFEGYDVTMIPMPDNSPTLEATEMGEMAFCAALLFAFPAIRNAQPFAPTMGVLSDYLGFFWAESIVAISLIIKLNIWLRRKKHD